MGNLIFAIFIGKFYRSDARFLFALDRDFYAHVLDLGVLKNFEQIVNRRMRHVVGL